MINERNFDRVAGMIDPSKVIFGGKTDRADKFIAPTIMDNVTREDAVMHEEIFGPVLPMMSYSNLDEVKDFINEGEKPLVLYMFSKNKQDVESVLKSCSSGGVCINDCFLQYGNKNLPFGGVGMSGIGHYNGDYTFDTFSHLKAEFHKSFSMDSDVRYPPFDDKKFKSLKFALEKLNN